MPQTTPDRLKHYHELKMTGSFSSESVINLIQFATALTLRQIEKVSELRIPVENLDLYDVNHIDTGTRRSVGKRYDDVRVYKSQMAKINASPLTGRIALTQLSMVGIGLEVPEMRLTGKLEVEDLSAIQDVDIAAAVEQTLKGDIYDSEIIGDLTIGQSFNFGLAEFWAPPNENYDSLINIYPFNDKRYTA